MLGDKIRQHRKRNHISQEELAEKLGVSRQSISLWENNQTQPTIENIVSLSKLLGVSTDELLSTAPDEKTPPTNIAAPANATADSHAPAESILTSKTSPSPLSHKNKILKIALPIGTVVFICLIVLCVVISSAMLSGENKKIDTTESALDTTANITPNNKKTLIVAIEDDFFPFSYKENNEYCGIHIDIAKEMAYRLDCNVEFVSADFEELIDGVANSRYDLALGIEKNSYRETIVSFTEPYYDYMCIIFRGETFSEWSNIRHSLTSMLQDDTIQTILTKYGIDYSYCKTCGNLIDSTSSYCSEHTTSTTETNSQPNTFEYTRACLSIGCDNLCDSIMFYCSEHACIKSNCSSEKSISSDYCIIHKCDSIGCDNGRNDFGYYCSNHACADTSCIREKTFSGNYCSWHECNEVLCKNRKNGYGSYCVEHECSISWCSSAKSPLSNYCFMHDN